MTATRYRTPYVLGILLVLGGLLLLAYTQVSTVLPDPSRTELSSLTEGSVIGEGTAVVFSALLVTLGLVFVLANASPAPLWSRAMALGVLGVVLPTFLIVQTLLIINGVAVQVREQRVVQFSVSYFFHTGGDLSFGATYILFFFTLTLVVLIVGSIGYLLVPRRFWSALFDRRSWPKNESVHVAATLLLLLSIGVLFYYFLRLVVSADVGAMRDRGLLGQNLVPLYYLLCVLLFLFFLTVAAHAFLLTWGNQTPLEFGQLVENLRTVARVERGLLMATSAVNLLIILSPQLVTGVALTHSSVFGVSPRGLNYALFLLLLPYVPYWVSQRRLGALLLQGIAPAGGEIFAERSLRLVLTHVLGIALITTWAVAAIWDPLGLMVAYSSWTAGVLFVHAVRLQTERGLPRLVLRGEGGPPLYFGFLVLSLTTGLMLWGAGNTFEVSYLPHVNALEFTNEANYGVDVLGRIASTIVIAGTLVLTLDLWLHTSGVPRRFLGHYLGIFLSATLAALFVFTVGVWRAGEGGIEDAYAGFAFRQFYASEETGAGLLLTGTVLFVAWSLRRVLKPVLGTGSEHSSTPGTSRRGDA